MKGKFDSFDGKAVIAFVDLLGYSKDICDNWESERNDEHPLVRIKELKKRVKNNRRTSYINMDDIEYASKIKYISDSFILTFGEEGYYNCADHAYGVLTVANQIASVWREALKLGFTVRGALAYGPMYWDASDIIGPAFIEAYRMETSQADSSRVVCSNDIANKVLEAYEGDYYIHEAINKAFRIDTDGKLIISPHLLYESDAERQEYLGVLNNLRSNITDDKIRSKYDGVISILSESVEETNITESALRKFIG